MKHSYVLPITVLGILLAFCMWNAHSMTSRTQRWDAQLRQVEALALEGQWPDAGGALERSYNDWQGSQNYLHIVSRHEAVDDAEAMYRRAAVSAEAGDLAQLQSELADLRHQLRLLAEMERCNLRNIL